jgi:hypothetical protein
LRRGVWNIASSVDSADVASASISRTRLAHVLAPCLLHAEELPDRSTDLEKCATLLLTLSREEDTEGEEGGGEGASLSTAS